MSHFHFRRCRGSAPTPPELIAREAPQAVPVIFGHLGEGNMHLNVLRCDAGRETRIYAAMMGLIAAHGGNVSSEHGVGSLKRRYLALSREPSDIAAMRTIKAAFDPTGYLNPAVLFDLPAQSELPVQSD